MNGNIIPFPAQRARRPQPVELRAGGTAIAADLGTAEEWLTSAILHLKAATSGRTDGSEPVAVAALHLVLAYVEDLEARLGLIPPGGVA